MPDGTVATFNQDLSDRSIPPPQTLANQGRISQLRRPNGETLSFFYQIAQNIDDPGQPDYWAIRLKSVRNNYGYALIFTYELDGLIPPTYLSLGAWQRMTKATALNRTACVSLVTPCPSTTPWPSANFSGATTTDQSGRATYYGSDGTVYTQVLRLPENPTVDAVRYSLDTATLRVTSAQVAGQTWNYAYAEAGGVRTVTITDPDGGTSVARTTTATGLLASFEDQLDRTTSYEYDSNSRVTRIALPRGNSVSYVYDGRGNVTQTTYNPTLLPGPAPSPIVTSATYPSSCANPVLCNQPETTTDANGAVTNYTYDATHGGVTSIRSPAPTTGAARPETRITYEARQAWISNGSGGFTAEAPITLPVAASACTTGSSCAGTANEVKTTIAYGTSGEANNLHPTVLSSGSGNGALTAAITLTYTDRGDVASVDGPLSGTADTTTYRYDDARQPVGVIGPDPDGGGALLRRAQRVTYNADGAATLVEQGTVTGLTDPNWAAFASLQQVAIAHDVYGRPTHQRLQAAGTTFSLAQIGYDAQGRTDCVATRMNPSAFASPPASACTSSTTAGYGPDRIMKYGYDVAGQLTSTISGYGSGTTITESATYSANGLPLTLTDGKGNVSTLEYDNFDRLSRLRYPNKTGGGSSTTDFVQYAYDDNGNVVSLKTRAQAVTSPITYDFNFTYDALNRRTLLNAPTGLADTSYTYDNLGRMLSANNGVINSQAWDTLGRLTSETGPLGTMSYQYDLAGRRTRQTWPDAFFVTNSWNLADEMTAVLHGGATQIVGFAYDNLGRRTGISRSNGVNSTYGYDGAGRLTSLSHDVGGTAADVTYTYAYNPAGQITSKTTSNDAYLWTPSVGSTAYTLNGLNQVTAAGATSLTYDANGNLTHDGTRAYAFDAANRLTGNGTATISYDALGRLDNYVGTSGARYLYDGVEAAGFATSGSTINTRFIRGPGVDEILASYTSAGSTPAQFWLSDERGSLVDTVNGSTGVSTAINTYDEYGNPGSGNVGRFQYTGQMWLPSFGAYHYKARAYHPGLGRFLQTDPIGYTDGANLYAYVGGDPVNLVDSLGLWGVETPCDTATDTPDCTAVGPPVSPCTRGWSCIGGNDWFWGRINYWDLNRPTIGSHFRAQGYEVLQELGYDDRPDTTQCTIASYGRLLNAAATGAGLASTSVQAGAFSNAVAGRITTDERLYARAILISRSGAAKMTHLTGMLGTVTAAGMSYFAGDNEAGDNAVLSLVAPTALYNEWLGPLVVTVMTNTSPLSNPKSCFK
ncbi:RHS repeat domain-containing protein [Brevundimonas diminuta]|uniref:RHS repeat domain-containing protein n=1 Tax=Brevundimonas diminuta TaxID=293 RepID=UPI003208B8CF